MDFLQFVHIIGMKFQNYELIVTDLKERKMIKYEKIGPRIRLIREFIGFTREGLADRVGISTKYLYEIETGNKDFSAKILYKLSLTLDVSMDYLMDGISGKKFENEKLVDAYLIIKSKC